MVNKGLTLGLDVISIAFISVSRILKYRDLPHTLYPTDVVDRCFLFLQVGAI